LFLKPGIREFVNGKQNMNVSDAHYHHLSPVSGGGDALAQHITQALLFERNALALAHADADIDLRLDTGEVARFVEVFLQKRWRQVLAHAYCDADAATQQDLLALMDQLIKSAQPKFTADQCQDFLQGLPAMVAKLAEWLDKDGWQGPERDIFFIKLAERHAMVARGPLSARHRIEQAVNSAQKASERRWEHESRVEALANDQNLRDVRQMQLANWIEVLSENENALHYYKLSWVSPRQMVLVFVERDGQDFFSITVEKLAERLHDHSARILSQEPLA
jgi:hypothetical protein